MMARCKAVIVMLAFGFFPGLLLADCDPFKERDGDKVITQGEFAVLVAQALDVKRTDTWTCQEAKDALTAKDVDIQPEDGWQVEKELEEGPMVEVIRRTGLQISTVQPKNDVTWSTAKIIVAQLSRMMVKTDGKFLRSRPKTFETGRPLASPTEP